MQLEEYFDFLAPDDIRVKGTRIGIETILFDYLELGLFAEQIATRYPTLSLEQVYATLTYYWQNPETVTAYLRLVEQETERHRREIDLWLIWGASNPGEFQDQIIYLPLRA